MRVLLKEVFKNHEFSKNFEEQFREKTVIDEIVDVFVNKYLVNSKEIHLVKLLIYVLK